MSIRDSLALLTGRLLVFALASTNAIAANSPDVVIDFRPSPGADSIGTTVTEAITSLRVINDRGIIAKSRGQLSARPTRVSMLSVQHTRNLSGSVSPDGSFFSEIRYLGNTTTVKDFYGRERVLTEALSNSGLQVIVRVEADGSVPEQSLKLNGLSKQQLDLLRDPLTATLKQTAQMAPLKLAFGSNAEQRLLLQIPIPGLTQLKVKATVSSQLVGLDRGVAEIQRLFSLDFETPAGVLKFTADGAGSGKSVYDTTSKLMLREETGILMRATFEFPEGTIEAEVTSKSLQTTRPTFSKTNDLRAHRWVQYYLISGNEPNDWDAHEIDIESLKITGELLQYSTRIKYADGSVGPPLEMQVNCAKGTRGQLPNPSMSATFQGTIGGQELRIACLAGVREFQ